MAEHPGASGGAEPLAVHSGRAGEGPAVQSAYISQESYISRLENVGILYNSRLLVTPPSRKPLIALSLHETCKQIVLTRKTVRFRRGKHMASSSLTNRGGTRSVAVTATSKPTPGSLTFVADSVARRAGHRSVLALGVLTPLCALLVLLIGVHGP